MNKLTAPIIVSLLLILGFNYCSGQDQNNPSRSQVKFFFPGAKLPENFIYNFPVAFKEVKIKAIDSTLLSGVLFSADRAKGVILYLPGNTGAIDKWGNISKIYTSLGYDLLIPGIWQKRRNDQKRESVI